MPRALLAVAERVEFEPDRADFEHVPQALGEKDQLGVDVRAGQAERLDVDLVELAIAAALRALVAEHRAPCSRRGAARRR